MDVRCERCRAHYVFDDAQVTEAGLTVKCSNCGHLFKVKKKALVVTVPVKPGEATEEPFTPTTAPPAGAPPAAAARSSPPAAPPLPPEKREWRVRQANGNVFTFKELTTLQKWIVEKKVSRDDEISLSGDQWKRLGNIAELAAFFQVVEAAERGQSVPPALTPLPLSLGYPGTGSYPLGYPPGYPPPSQGYPAAPPLPQQSGMPPAMGGSVPASAGAPPGAAWESQPPAQPQAAAPEPAWATGGRRALPDQEVDAEDVRPRKGGGGKFFLLFLLALAGGAAAVWYLKPEWLAAAGIRSSQATVPSPPVAQAQPPAKPEPPPPAPAPAPPRAEPPPAVEKAPEVVKEPQMVKGPARPQPKTVRQLLAEAQRLRERGKVEQALDSYGRIVDMHPDSAAALAGRGWCYLDLSQYAPAEASFQAALATDSTHAEALIGLAETYRYEGRRAEAIGYYQKYLAAHPDGEDAVAARNALSQLKE